MKVPYSISLVMDMTGHQFLLMDMTLDQILLMDLIGDQFSLVAIMTRKRLFHLLHFVNSITTNEEAVHTLSNKTLLDLSVLKKYLILYTDFFYLSVQVPF